MDLDLDETWDQQVERELQEAAAKHNKTYAVSTLQVTDRRAWERFVRELAAGLLPSKPIVCSWCEALTSQKDYFCGACFKAVAPRKAADRTTEGEIREVHTFALGEDKVELQRVSKGT